MQFFIQHVSLVTMGDKLLIYLWSGNPLELIRGMWVDALAPSPPPLGFSNWFYAAMRADPLFV